jgi:hypothetical protein
MKLRTLQVTIVLAVASLMTPVTYGENGVGCAGLEAGLQRVRGGLPASVVERIRTLARRTEGAPVPGGVACTALGNVLSRLVNGSFQGGKKLHDDKPLDVAAAQAELEQALQQNPEFKAQLDGLRDAVPDEQERMLYEAALLQSNNLYGARDLRLQQLMQKAKGG